MSRMALAASRPSLKNRLLGLLAVLVLVATALVFTAPQAKANDGGYPWANATTLNAATYDWGYATCPNSAPNCKTKTYPLNGVLYGQYDPWNYYFRNCTSYVAWKLSSLGVPASKFQGLGSGGSWTNADSKGVTVNTTPAAGSVAINTTVAGGYGHVAYVESVSGGNITVSEYNWSPAGTYGTRTVAASSFHYFAHYEALSGVPSASSLQADPEGPNLPVGDIALQREPGGVRVYGWATDPDTSAALAVHVYGGTGEATSSNPLVGVYADQYRSDVGNHAFSAFFTVGAGQHTFCAYGINVGLGQNRRFDCASITVISSPVGNLESVQRVPGGVQLSGWALDPDYGGQILVHAYGGNGQAVSGNPMAAAYTDVSRPDVAAAWPGYGDVHGFSLFISTGSSTRFCLYGFNVSGTPGSTSQLPCYDLNVAPNPVGNLESVQRVPGGVQLSGWALDPDTSGPILVHLYGGSGAAVSGNPLVGTYADVSRPDVAAAWPGYGDAHGFSVFMPTGSNVQTFCLYGINANGTPGSNGQILCRNG